MTNPWNHALSSKPRNEWKTTEEINAEAEEVKRTGITPAPVWASALISCVVRA